MRVEIYSSHKNISPVDIRGKNVVVVDVLRATSTLIFAFANGLKRVLAVNDPLNAPDYIATLNNDRILMGGTEDFKKIVGFDAGDTIADYQAKRIKGKELVYYSVDASPAINIGYSAKRLFLGGFVNMRAVASKLAALGGDAVIICAGTAGHFALEDGLAAGGIINEIRAQGKKLRLSEGAFVVDKMYRTYQKKLSSALTHSVTYNRLVQLDATEDIAHALSPNIYDFVPFLYDNWVTADPRKEGA